MTPPNNSAPMDMYSFDNAWIRAHQRLRGLEQLLDPGTIRHLEALGVGDGWHCLEVGAGGGSIAEWLCQRVGRNGYVMATDLNTRFLEALTMPNLDVRRHNIVSDDLPGGRFDLVLSRLVVGHIQERECALGLIEVHAEGRVPLLLAGTAATHWKRLSVEQLRKDIINAHVATEAEIEAYYALLDAPNFVSQGFIVMTAWGRRPNGYGPALLSNRVPATAERWPAPCGPEGAQAGEEAGVDLAIPMSERGPF